MADIFVSYTRADQEIVRKIVALLEAQGWNVWWDTRIGGGERWDATIEREIKAARCVVVVWTPQSVDREWVREEADHGRDRGILVPILIGIDKPPFGFGRIQARDLTGWGGATKTGAADQFLTDVRLMLGGTSPPTSLQSQPQSAQTHQSAMGSHLDPYGSLETMLDDLRALVTQREDRVKVDAKIIHGAPEGWFLPGAGKTEWFKDIDIGPEMVVVPAGEFIMGSNANDSEKPPHKVTIPRPFVVGRFAVTFAEWDAAGLAHRPADRGWGRGRRPVINVSWEDAKAYASWLSEKTWKTYRLLSEAEWEYCCRAGTTTEYAFGDSITSEQAQFSGKQTAEVGRFPPNAWGLHDMHGNVWEWCEDSWHPDYKGAPQDGSVWQGGDARSGVLRGGSWFYGPGILRSANRLNYRYHPAYRDYIIGFRLARTV